MCNINIVYKLDGVPDECVVQCMNCMSNASWVQNDDGEGVIRRDGVGKRVKIERSLHKMIFRGASYLMSTHQRYKTSGRDDLSNVHPHSTKHLTVQHNGVFVGLGDAERSDSKFFADLLEDEFVKSHDVVRAVRGVARVVRGSYSVVVLERKSKRLFYFKNAQTAMWVCANDDFVVMSTRLENAVFARKFLGMGGADVHAVKSGVVFELCEKGLVVRGKFDVVEDEVVVPAKKKLWDYYNFFDEGKSTEQWGDE